MQDRVMIRFRVAPRESTAGPSVARIARLRADSPGEIVIELPDGRVRLRVTGRCIERFAPAHITTLRGRTLSERPATVVVHCGLAPPGLFLRAGEMRSSYAITHEDQDRIVAALRALGPDVSATAPDRIQIAV